MPPAKSPLLLQYTSNMHSITPFSTVIDIKVTLLKITVKKILLLILLTPHTTWLTRLSPKTTSHTQSQPLTLTKLVRFIPPYHPYHIKGVSPLTPIPPVQSCSTTAGGILLLHIYIFVFL